MGAARRFLGAAVSVLAALAAAPESRADAAAGRAKSAACATCHGPKGLSTLIDAPHLAGQSEIYLSTQLKAYRSGRRVHEVMSVIAKPLSDADIADLAAWYSSFTIEVREKP